MISELPTGERLERAKELIQCALGRDPATLAAWLAAEVADDPGLQSYVLGLLQAGSRPGPGFAGIRRLAVDYLAGERPSRIGCYSILDVLGEGGMGTVYLAEQTEPVRRRVALKLLKLGMDSAAVVARFEQERQALAVMEHDGIAKVHDCGTSERGQPFFVMELVHGVPLAKYCDDERLSLSRRLLLMQKVCEAVQHAHQKGVVHRDLKPSNVLVVAEGEQLDVKIIDFGLAKAIREKFTDAALLTSPGQIVGTLEYMAPEQADPSNPDIDTRADVYSLGVMLYEMVVGSLPFSSQKLRGTGLLELQRLLREVDPERPSARLEELGAGSRAIAAARQCTVGALRMALRDDLDWIVLRAMEKDRERRYESAAALSADVQRFLDDQPLAAGPPSAGYRLRKFVKRHGRQVVAVVAVLVTAIVGAVVATSYAISAMRLAEEKGRLAMAERRAKEEALQQERRADANAAQFASKVREFDCLAGVVLHARAVEQEQSLHPPWPSKIAAMEQWELATDKLLAKIPEIERTVQDLRARARPRSATAREADRRSHARWAEYERARGLTQKLVRAQALAAGAPLLVPEVPAHFAVMTGQQLLAEADNRVSLTPADASVHGEEGLGLALARLALDRAPGGPASVEAQLTLAWALLANGQFDRALQAAEDAVASVPEAARDAVRGRWEEVRAAIAGLSTAIASRRAELAELDRVVDEQRTFEFELESQQFLHDTLVVLREKLATLGATKRVDVERRLAWARQVGQLTRGHPNARHGWDEVRRALAAADDVVASARYRGVALELRDEDVCGLVPIGMNPVTKLWEFYDLRSAWDGSVDPRTLAIPVHRPDGSIAMVEDTGLVLVLLPGGTFTMGAQNDDADAPNYDADAAWYMKPPHEVVLAPFWLSKYEMTQGQWARLWQGEPAMRWPSRYRAGAFLKSLQTTVTAAYPVDQVDWNSVLSLLRHHGMTLPTEAQWEYGCRGDTTTPWCCPRAELRHHANLADEAAKRVHADWQTHEPWDDGHVIAAPVDSFRPNGFGLFHMHGNVTEWCLDRFGPYTSPVRAGDGLRQRNVEPTHIVRGGGMSHMATFARSGMRTPAAATQRAFDLGARPARALRAAP